MKRFIDLRGQHTGYRFAWWDTVRDCFEENNSDFAWDTWQEFEEWYCLDGGPEFRKEMLDRYRRLTPAWAFDPVPDDDYG